MATEAAIVQVGRRSLRLSNLGKVLYPKVGFTKAQLIEYYLRIAPALLPHLKGRPLTLKRYPNGVEAPYFYEKNCPAHRPSWIKTAPIRSSRSEKPVEYCLCNDVSSLVWAANLADLELHTSLSLAKRIERPTMVVFDLDPGAPAALLECCEVALMVKRVFDALKLKSFVKTSGSKGIQVYVPLNTPTSYDETKPFAKQVAELLERQNPSLIVSKMKKSLRAGKVFVDWSQNDEHKTTVNVYSLRARERPTVSTPVTWKEIEAARTQRDARRLDFDSRQVLERVEEQGDLFAPVLKLTQRLPK